MENKQTAVEWLIQRIYMSDFEIYNFMKENADFEQAKEMEKQQTMNAVKNELKLIDSYFDVSKLETKEQGHHIRFTAILKDRFDYYNKTYGGNK